MAHIVVASTIAPYKTFTNVIGYGPEECMWLLAAEEMIADAASEQHELSFFVAQEVDARASAPYTRLHERLDDIRKRANVDIWTFMLDTGAERTGSEERLAHICMGRNLITEYAIRVGADYIMHLDTDVAVPGDTITSLLEVDWPIVGGNVPNYCLNGEEEPVYPARVTDLEDTTWPQRHTPGDPYGFPVEGHWNTAGFLLVHRTLFRRLRWRTDPDSGTTDDPCYGEDAIRLGWLTLVRKDVHGHHTPLEPLEQRDHDLTIAR